MRLGRWNEEVLAANCHHQSSIEAEDRSGVFSAEMVNVVGMEICRRVLYDVKMIVRHEG